MRRLAVNCLVALGSLLIFASVLEGGLRLAGFAPERAVNPVFSWKARGELWMMHPGASWTTRMGNHRVDVNALGLRDREIGPCREDRIRILLLGDSVTFGHGVPMEATLARQLERTLAAAGQPVEVINAGVPGWSTRQQRLFYEQYGERLCPDVVLVCFVLNDVTELQHGRFEIGLEHGLLATSTLSWLAERTATVAAWKRLYATLVDPARREIAGVRDLVHRADAPEVRRAMTLVTDEIASLRALAAERGDAFGLVLFPFRFQLLGDDLGVPQARLAHFAGAREIPVLDTLPLLRGDPPERVLLDHDHLTAHGHRIVADAVAAWLSQTSMIAPAPAD